MHWFPEEDPMRSVPLTLVVAFSTLVRLHAQDGLRKPAEPPAPAHETMVLTGCLMAGADPATFKLTNILSTQPPADPRRPVGSSGERIEYELKAEARLDTASVAPPDLKQFVGHEVEITARPLASPPETGGKTAGAGTPEAAAPKAQEPKIEKLTVTAIKQVFATCR
jgi:hypothetical protein